MAEERRVEMVRLVGEEPVYDREAILGRDATSVFPTLARQQHEEAAGAAGLSVDAIKEALGARRFISESELETIRATRGATADDGAVAVDKPLAEILRERKAAKEAEQEDKWKQMKIGKNRPLDAEELQFLDSVAVAEAERERAWNEMERAELEAFKAAVRERSAEPDVATASGSDARSRSAGTSSACRACDPRIPVAAAGVAGGAPSSALRAKPLIKAVVKVKPKGAPPGSKTDAAAAGEPPNKKLRSGEDDAPATTDAASSAPAPEPGAAVPAAVGGSAASAAEAATGAGSDRSAGVAGGRPSGGAGLTGLIGDYGSDSDADGD